MVLAIFIIIFGLFLMICGVAFWVMVFYRRLNHEKELKNDNTLQKCITEKDV